MTLLGERVKIIELFKVQETLPIRIGLRGRHSDKCYCLCIDRLFADVLEGYRNPCAESGLYPPKAPFGSVGITYPVTWGKMAGEFITRHFYRIARPADEVDSWVGRGRK